MLVKNSTIIPVVACVILHEGKYLITQRLKRSHLGHLWEFPGGKLEALESQEECAIRECQEELGILVKPLQLISEFVHHYKEISVQLYFWLCTWVGGEVQALECADFAWITADALINYEFPAADKALIETLSKKKHLLLLS